MKESKKKKRSENWLEEDKTLLKVLVRERVRAIENKKCNSTSNMVKAEAWNNIRKSFNDMCKGVPRSVVQLRLQWKMIKMRAKKQKSVELKDPLINCCDQAKLTVTRDISTTTDETQTDCDEIHQTSPSQTSDLTKDQETTVKEKEQTEHSAERLLAFEMQCREELHKAQMANEELRKNNEELIKNNLILKQKLLKTKLEFYERKINEL